MDRTTCVIYKEDVLFWFLGGTIKKSISLVVEIMVGVGLRYWLHIISSFIFDIRFRRFRI